MSELWFPVVGALLVMLVLLPLGAFVSKALFGVLERSRRAQPLRLGAAGYLALVLPTLLPLCWVISAGWHQAESGRSVLACLLSHDLDGLCSEPLAFVALVAGAVVLRVGPHALSVARRARVRGRAPAPGSRIARLIASRPELAGLAGRVRLAARGSLPEGSVALGWWRPHVCLSEDFIDRCDDEALAGALAHELEHVRAYDPVRYFLLGATVRLNPLGARCLGREAAGWIFRRELECDRAAVAAGAEPFGVARALLQASRGSAPLDVAAMNGGPRSKLRLRIELLLAYAERRPSVTRSATRAAARYVGAAALVATLLPHLTGTRPLDAVHTGVERAAARLLGE